MGSGVRCDSHRHFLTAITLFVLWGYAADTKKIAKASDEQIENSQKPFLSVSWKVSAEHTPAGWGIENQGFGPALSVRFSLRSNAKEWRSIADIAKDDRRTEFHDEIKRHIQNPESESYNNRPFRMEYSSLSGVRYRTTIERLENQELKTTFERLK